MRYAAQTHSLTPGTNIVLLGCLTPIPAHGISGA